MNIRKIAEKIRGFEGISYKRQIRMINDSIKNSGMNINLDEDGVVFKAGDEYCVAACDAIQQELCSKAPYNAGRAAIVASVNDIYAMGGRPLVILNAVGAENKNDIGAIVKGMADAASLFGLKINGGHLLPIGTKNSVSVTIIGKAKNPIKSTTLKKEDRLILISDLIGEQSPAWKFSWNSTFDKSQRKVRSNYNVIGSLSEKGCFTAGKDISSAGILGTVSILLESSGKGSVLDLEKIDSPPGVDRIDWFRSFLSFGFIFGVKKNNVEDVAKRIKKCGLCANIIGTVDDSNAVFIKKGNDTELLFDWSIDKILKEEILY